MKPLRKAFRPPWGRDSDEWPPLLAFSFVILALGALAITPAVLLHRVVDENQKVNWIILEAEAGVRELAIAREDRMALARRELLAEDARFARALAEAEAAEARALDRLERLAPLMGSEFIRHVQGLRTHVAERNALEVIAARRGGGVEVYGEMVPEFQVVRDSVAVNLSGLRRELVQAAAVRRAQDRRWEELQRTMSILLGTLALLAALTVGWFALRQRQLMKGIQRALRTENRMRALADQRTRDLKEVMESRVRLLQGITHDVKNPLSAAKGYAELLQMGSPVAMLPEQAPLVAGVQRSLDGALAIVADLLDLARADAGGLPLHFSGCDLRDVVRGAAEDYRPAAETAGNTMELSLPAEPVRVYTDPARVGQVLGNLLSNAIKYTTPPGRIDVGIEVVRSLESAWVAVRVSDSGPGIPNDQNEAIFNEFSRLEEGGGQSGHGLGLPIARRIARLIGGDLMVDTAVSGGASFVLNLPLTVDDRRLPDSSTAPDGSRLPSVSGAPARRPLARGSDRVAGRPAG